MTGHLLRYIICDHAVSEIYKVAKMMSTWTLRDWFQFLFENTVLSGRCTSTLINLLFNISRVYQKSEENVDFT